MFYVLDSLGHQPEQICLRCHTACFHIRCKQYLVQQSSVAVFTDRFFSAKRKILYKWHRTHRISAQWWDHWVWVSVHILWISHGAGHTPKRCTSNYTNISNISEGLFHALLFLLLKIDLYTVYCDYGFSSQTPVPQPSPIQICTHLSLPPDSLILELMDTFLLVLSVPGSLVLCMMSGHGCLCLILSTAGKSFSWDGWARHCSMRIPEWH